MIRTFTISLFCLILTAGVPTAGAQALPAAGDTPIAGLAEIPIAVFEPLRPFGVPGSQTVATDFESYLDVAVWQPLAYPLHADAVANDSGGESISVLEPEVDVVEEATPPPKRWEGNLQFGINGSRGNSDNLNFRFGAHAKRSTAKRAQTFDLKYKNDNSNRAQTANRLFVEVRHERIVEDSAWSFFVHGTSEQDEFRPFDFRLSTDGGLGYQSIATETTSLLSRVGGGVSREYGGSDESHVPEAILGLEFDHQLNKRQKLSASVDYFPDWTEFGEYRVNSQADWQILLDEELNLSLKLGVIDRYDSTPNGAEPNDFDYSAVLLWSY